MIEKYSKIICAATFFAVGIIGLLLKYFIFPTVINSSIDENIALNSDTEQYMRWETLPTPLYFKVYFFTVENPKEVSMGGKPRMKEIGPYVYKETRHKENVTRENGLLTYYDVQKFEFDLLATNPSFPFDQVNGDGVHSNTSEVPPTEPLANKTTTVPTSKATLEPNSTQKLLTEDDEIVIPNLPLMAIALTAESEGADMNLVRIAIQQLFNNTADLFLKTTPKSILFDGIRLKCRVAARFICNKLEKEAPNQVIKEGDILRFSLLGFKNRTADKYWVKDGIDNISQVGQIMGWGERTNGTMGKWENSSSCDEIHGTDSTIFSPHQSLYLPITAFQADICRSSSLEPIMNTEFNGVEAIRYELNVKMLESPKTRTENSCYCRNKTRGIVDENGCLLDGAMELIDCLGAPVVMTFPHFYGAAKEYTDGVTGLRPKKELHESFAVLEPNTGIVLSGYKRGQLNIFFRKLQDIDITENLESTLMPVLWFEEGTDLGDKFVTQLKSEFLGILWWLNLLCWGMIIIGLTFGFFGTILYLLLNQNM